MHPELEKLLRLQDVDRRLDILQRELQSQPQLVEERDRRVQDIRAREAELEAQRKAKKIEIDRLDLEVKTFDGKVAETRKKLGNASTNQEYTGLNHQIKTYEEQKSAVEDSLLVLWEEMENLESESKELQGALEEAREVLDEERRRVDAEVKEIQTAAAKLVEEREAAIQGIETEALELYEVLFSRHRNRSVVSAENGICAGCMLSLEPQTINLVRHGADLVQCTNCGRLLYL